MARALCLRVRARLIEKGLTTLAGRLGYGARGLVYAIVAFFALDATLRLHPERAKGLGEGSSLIGQQPGGRWLLGLLGLGLLAHAIWRAVQAFADVDHRGRSARGLAARAWFALLGIFYGALAWKIISLLAGHRPPSKRHAMVQVLATRPGRALVFAVGGALLVAAVGQLVKAWRASFCDELEVAGRGRLRALTAVGRVGLLARAGLFTAGGLLLIRSSLRASADTVGVGDVLRRVAESPFGRPSVGLLAVGLFAYAALMLGMAVWRRVT